MSTSTTAEQVTAPASRTLDQHPETAAGTYMAHCCGCGTYLEETSTEPAADLLCDPCQEADDEDETRSTA